MCGTNKNEWELIFFQKKIAAMKRSDIFAGNNKMI